MSNYIRINVLATLVAVMVNIFYRNLYITKIGKLCSIRKSIKGKNPAVPWDFCYINAIYS